MYLFRTPLLSTPAQRGQEQCDSVVPVSLKWKSVNYVILGDATLLHPELRNSQGETIYPQRRISFGHGGPLGSAIGKDSFMFQALC